jgi:hypothetical protein
MDDAKKKRPSVAGMKEKAVGGWPLLWPDTYDGCSNPSRESSKHTMLPGFIKRMIKVSIVKY